MRLLACAFLLAAPWVSARDEAADRAEVDKLMLALKDALGQRNPETLSKLLASDTNRPELSRTLLNLSPAAPDASQRPWSELSRPVLMINSVRFPEEDLAEVYTVSVQYGSVITRNSAALVFLLKRERSGWKIESFQVGPPLPQ